MLVVPGSLLAKTRREFKDLCLHWQINLGVRIESYEKLALAEQAELFEQYLPDGIIFDEGHRLKRVTKSACPRRVARFLARHPATKIYIMSGTLTKDSFADYAHLLDWCLRDGAPIPRDVQLQAMWAQALDANVQSRPSLTYLESDLGVAKSTEEIRALYRERLCSAPGVIISTDSFDAAGLEIRPRYLDAPEKLSAAFADLRQLWQAPDEWLLGDPFEVWHVARQLALGFCYTLDPRPPDDWYQARKAWYKVVRGLIEQNIGYDTRGQVEAATEAGELTRFAPIYAEWKKLEPTFVPNHVPIWLSTHAIDSCARWSRGNPWGGIVWCEHVAFAKKLEDATGWRYFGSEGVCAEDGSFIENARVKEIVIASVDANSTGRNLQKWRTALFTSPPMGSQAWEQQLGRQHRDGQKADVVRVQYFVGCVEHATSAQKALVEATYVQQTTGQTQKLLTADLTLPSLKSKKGPAWELTQGERTKKERQKNGH